MTEPAVTTALVIPCFNEAARLDPLQLGKFLAEYPAYSLILVDDGSTDETKIILQDLCSNNIGRCSFLILPTNQGKAEAVRQGMMKALEEPSLQYFGYWDADLATPLETAPRFQKIMEKNLTIHMVFGSRVLLMGHDIHRTAVRHYLGRVFMTIVSTMLSLPIYDSQCGAKIFRITPETRILFSKEFISRWVFDVEIIARFCNCFQDRKITNSSIYEYPLETWHDVDGSKVKLIDFLKSVIDLGRIWLSYFYKSDSAKGT